MPVKERKILRLASIDSYYKLRIDLSNKLNIPYEYTDNFIDLIDELYSNKIINSIGCNSIVGGHICKIILDICNVTYFMEIREVSSLFHIPKATDVYIPSTKYYLNIKEAIKNILLFMFTYWITRELSMATLIDIFSNIIKPSISKIEDFEYCTLAAVISYSKDNKEFGENNIIQIMNYNMDKECNNRSELWVV